MAPVIEKIRRLALRLGGTLRHSPAETALAVYSFVICALTYEEILPDNSGYIRLLPVFFSVSLILNRLCGAGRLRIVYYLSPLLALPLLGTDVSDWTESAAYPVTLGICALSVAASGWMRDNRPFVARIVRYGYDLAASALLSGVAFLALLAIFFSVVYIFNVFESAERDFTFYAAMAMFVLLLPVSFLAFNRDSDLEEGITLSPFYSVLMNYILTPAVLAYTLILYLYFGRILVEWSLPKGGIAYLVFAYGIVAMAVKAGQLLLPRQIYGWYYRYFSLISLPALLMFWIGALYRVGQYGLTEPRVYLLVCGAVMTLTILLFLNSRTGRYLYATVLAVALLAVFTYIPGLTAASIGVRSQEARAGRLIVDLGLSDGNGRVKLEKRGDADTIRKDDYRALYESICYVERQCGEKYVFDRYGVTNAATLQQQVIPELLLHYVESPWMTSLDGNADDSGGFPLTLESREPFDVEGYSRLQSVTAYSDGSGPNYSLRNDTLFIETSGDSVLLRIGLDAMLRSQLAATGFTPQDSIPADSLRAWRGRLLQYDSEPYRLLFRRVYFADDDSLKIENLDMDCFLIR